MNHVVFDQTQETTAAFKRKSVFCMLINDECADNYPRGATQVWISALCSNQIQVEFNITITMIY